MNLALFPIRTATTEDINPDVQLVLCAAVIV